MPNGTYSGSYTTGIYLDSAYPVATIAAAARIDVVSGDGVDGGATAYTLTNAGSIEAATGYGIYLQAGGTIDNLTGALVSGLNGVGLAAAGLVENAGTIAADSTDGTGVVIVDAGTVRNAGTISAHGRYAEGLYGADGDLVTNLAGGVIEATGHYGNAVDLGLSAMVRNAGTIVETHGGDAVLLGAGSCDNAAGATIAGGIGIEANGGPASTVTNAGLITGTYAGLYLHAGGTVSNTGGGTIAGGYGVLVAGTGRVQNAAGAAILGYAAGIEVKAGAGTVLNYGLVTTARGFDVAVLNGGIVLNAGSLAGRGGIELTGGGQVTNAASGRITTRRFGIEIQGPGGTVQNAGTVVVSGEYGKGVVLAIGDALTNAGLIEASGVYGAGVAVSGASSLQNAAAGTILATGSAGVAVSCTAPATIVNAGRIEESGGGIGLLAASGLVENEARGLIEGGIAVEFLNAAYATLVNDGVISGSLIGVEVRGVSAVTIDDAGTIANAAGAAGIAVDFKAGNDVLQLSPSSVLVGLVEGGIGTSRVELLAGAGVGTLSGIGTQFVDLTQILVDPGADWALQGSNTVASGTALVDQGSLTVGQTATLVVAGQVRIEGQGDLVIDSALHGMGTLDLSGGATLQLAAAAHGETVRFGAGGGLLTLGDPAHAALTLDGLGQLDVVDLAGVSYSATADTIVRTGAGVTIEQNGAVVAEFTIGGDTTLALRPDGHGGTELVNTGTYAGIYSGRFYQVVDVRHGAATLAAGSLVEVTLASGGAVYAGPGRTHAITNAGAIEAAGTGGAGVDIAGGGSFINASEGSVSAAVIGVMLGGSGGSVENAGMIQSAQTGIEIGQAGDVVNYGSILVDGAAGFGVELGGGAGRASLVNDGLISASGADGTGIQLVGGSVTNGRSGTIDAPLGVRVVGNGGSVENDGSIVAYGGLGIELDRGGVVINGRYGAILGPDGVRVVGNTGSVVNDGLIAGSGTGQGVYLAAGGAVYNAGGAVIALPDGVRVVGNTGSITNVGTIGDGTGLGVYLGAGGSVVNTAGGVIQGTIGIEIAGSAPATVVEYGTVSGTDYAVLFRSSADKLVVEAGAQFEGRIAGGGGRLKLAGGRGTIAGLGSIGTLSGDATGEFSGFGAYVFGADADWTLAGNLSLGPDQLLVNRGTLTVGDTLTLASALGGAGTIALDGGATLDLLAGGTGIVDFKGAGGVLELADPAGVTLALGVFRAGDTIDLTGIAYSPADTIAYGNSALSIDQGGTVVVSFAVYDLPDGADFTLESDGKGGTDLVVDPSIGNPVLADSVAAGQTATLAGALTALTAYVSQAEGVAKPGLNCFTPPALAVPGGTRHALPSTTPVAYDVNLENGTPVTAGETLQLGADFLGIVLTGSTAATLIGRAGAPELLVGNLGPDTIRGGGGSGTILSGSGGSSIRTGAGNLLVSSGGSDSIQTGAGQDTVDVLANATVHAGSGRTLVQDQGTAGDLVYGGAGTTVMKSGLGRDTFIGGSGISDMIDTGAGNLAVEFDKGLGGQDIVTGFDPAMGDYVRSTAQSFTAAAILGHATVTGGSTFVVLGDGTRIEFVGVTDLTAADFHS